MGVKGVRLVKVGLVVKRAQMELISCRRHWTQKVVVVDGLLV